MQEGASVGSSILSVLDRLAFEILPDNTTEVKDNIGIYVCVTLLN